jgi:hypothetical protein
MGDVQIVKADKTADGVARTFPESGVPAILAALVGDEELQGARMVSRRIRQQHSVRNPESVHT